MQDSPSQSWLGIFKEKSENFRINERNPYMPDLTLWDKISENLAYLEGNAHKNANLTEFSDHYRTDFMKK